MAIKVVQITENPIAGAPINLSKALNKWSKGVVESRHIAASDRNENRVFDSDIIINDTSKAEIFATIRGADVIHFHNFYRNQVLFKKWPELWPIVMTKKRVWQAHTQRQIGWMNMEEGLADKQARHLVIAQYHPRMYPECTVVPNIVDIFDPLLMPDWDRNNKPLRVVYSPSRVGLSGWDNKGYAETAPILQKLVDEGVIEAHIVYDKPHAECLAIKRKADICVDEVVTGSYHLNSLEGLSQGLVTIAGLDEIQIKTIRDLTGCEDHPWTVCNPKMLHPVLMHLSRDGEMVFRLQKRARVWMEKHWHPEVTIAHFLKVYASL